MELKLSQVQCLLDELDGKPINPEFWNGHHPNVYSCGLSQNNADKMVSALCGRLQKEDVSKRSLEMQIWWRDHQEADARHAKEELDAAKTAQEKEIALSKLTPYERKLLNL